MYPAKVPLTLVAVLLALLSASTCASPSSSVALEHRRVLGESVYVITANLNDPTIAVGVTLARGGLASSESFGGMVRRSAPIAAVTGTYFDTRSLLPVGTIVVEGIPIHRSAIGTAVSFAATSAVVPRSGAGASSATRGTAVRFTSLRKGQECDWGDVWCGLRTGPRLLDGGRYAFTPAAEGFRHPGLFGKRTRMVLGMTSHNKLLLVAVRTPVTFARTASIMKALGAVDAVCLDGGSSSAMYYRGKMVCVPGRRLTNIIEVRETPRQPAPGPSPTLVLTPEVIAQVEPLSGAEGLRCADAHPSEPTEPPEIAQQFHPLQPDAIRLRFAERRFALHPVDRAKLASLKRAQYPKHLIHVAPYV